MFELQDKKYSETRKHFTLTVAVSPWLSKNYSFRLKIVAFSALSDDDIDNIVEYVIDKRDEWKDRPDEKIHYFIKKMAATAYLNPHLYIRGKGKTPKANKKNDSTPTVPADIQ